MAARKLTQEAFLKKAVDVVQFYGFQSVDRHVERAKERATRKNRSKVPTLREKITTCDPVLTELVHTYAKKHLDLLSQPTLLYMAKPGLGKQPVSFGLFVIGSDRAIAEALVMHVSRAVLADLGYKDTCIVLNSIGDKESAAEAHRELTGYFRKNLQALPASCRQALKRDAFSALACVREKSPVLLEHIPKPVEFLTDRSRTHLRDVLEYLEASDAAYELDESLVGPRECYTESIFEIRERQDGIDTETSPVLAHGGRFDELPRRMYRRQVPIVGAVITAPSSVGRTPKTLPDKKPKTPDVYFVQVGTSAKQQSLGMMEALRKARTTIRHMIMEEKLSAQLEAAERAGTPYAVILGQKEALEGVAILRELSSRSQATVPMHELPVRIREALKPVKRAAQTASKSVKKATQTKMKKSPAKQRIKK